MQIADIAKKLTEHTGQILFKVVFKTLNLPNIQARFCLRSYSKL